MLNAVPHQEPVEHLPVMDWRGLRPFRMSSARGESLSRAFRHGAEEAVLMPRPSPNQTARALGRWTQSTGFGASPLSHTFLHLPPITCPLLLEEGDEEEG